MCGRIVQKTNLGSIAVNLGLDDYNDSDFVPRYNIPPGSKILVLRDKANLQFTYLQWGLIPSWSKKREGISNARAESVAEKPSFKSAFRSRRCVIPVDGFYEWKREGESKKPFYFYVGKQSPFYLAGLWEQWMSPEKELVETCTIITTAADKFMSQVHDRMPVIIPDDQVVQWIGNDNPSYLMEMISPKSCGDLRLIAVSSKVNSTRVDDASCIEAIG